MIRMNPSARRTSAGVALIFASTLLALTLSALAGVASAQDADQENAMRRSANELMTTSKWGDALPIWGKLYAQTGKAADLWNAAVCQYHLAKVGKAAPDEAIALLQQYRDSASISKDKKAKAQRYLDEMDALKKEQAAEASKKSAVAEIPPKAEEPAPNATTATTAAAATPAAAQATTAPPPSVSSAPVASLSTEAPSRQESGGHPLRIAAWTIGGVGVAAILVGGYFSLRVHSLQDQVTNAGQFNASDDSSARTAHTLQFVMYGIGAAAVATGCILYLLNSPGAQGSSVAIAPLAGSGIGGAVLQGRF